MSGVYFGAREREDGVALSRIGESLGTAGITELLVHEEFSY